MAFQGPGVQGVSFLGSRFSSLLGRFWRARCEIQWCCFHARSYIFVYLDDFSGTRSNSAFVCSYNLVHFDERSETRSNCVLLLFLWDVLYLDGRSKIPWCFVFVSQFCVL